MGMLSNIVLAALVLFALYTLVAIRSLKKKIEDAKDSFQSTISWSKEDIRGDISNLRSVMKVLASGGSVTPDMIEEGKPFADMSAADVEKFLNQDPKPDAVVIDVRSASEYQAGHIPGSKLVPIEEIEYRLEDVPKDVKTLFVVCAGGTRSAAACELLSKHGYTNLVNIYDGTASWPGKKEIGVMIRPPASARS
jgi:rhodanese-related sulfurtransferase